jgi:hypothetical protein
MESQKIQTLLTSSNVKTVKGEKLGYKTYILYLAPSKISGKNLCANATPGCILACLNSAGRGKFTTVQNARIKKAKFFNTDKDSFMDQLYKEITKLQKKFGNSLAIRLNGTSDIPFENIKVSSPLKDSYYTNIFEAFPTVRFYDYTKNVKRMFLNIPNYSLTFSRAESSLNIENSKTILNANKNVAIVFNNKLYTEIIKVGKIRYNNKLINVIDGDETDLRFLDKQNSIIALRAKGKAIKDTSGFVVHSLDEL